MIFVKEEKKIFLIAVGMTFVLNKFTAHITANWSEGMLFSEIFLEKKGNLKYAVFFNFLPFLFLFRQRRNPDYKIPLSQMPDKNTAFSNPSITSNTTLSPNSLEYVFKE